MLGQLYDDALSPSGLRATQRNPLATIQAHERAGSARNGGALVMDLSALGHSLKPRAGKGLVAIAPDRKDRSAKRVALTPAGVNKLRQTKRLWREAQDQFEAAFGAKRAKEMREILASLSTSESREAF